jgi:superfamily I DNA/RNA helicase
VSTFTPTDEQREIMDVLPTGRNVKVIAGAGAGKTETLNQAARRMKGRGLFTAFNRDIVQDAAARFPEHVACLTTHKLAYSAMFRSYRRRLFRSRSRQPSRMLAAMLGIQEPVNFVLSGTMVTPATLARLANATVSRFCNSDREQITRRDVPRQNGLVGHEEEELADIVLGYARTIWEDLLHSDAESGGRFNVDPNHLLKLFTLRKPDLPYDFILLDEAQDTNPAVASMLLRQGAQLIAVGDPAQAINEWRGAIDALSRWPAEVTLTLSRSFRFGPAVAEEGNKWLTLLGTDLRIIGAGGPSRVAECERPDAVLCRTNATAATEVLDALAIGRKVALPGETRTKIISLAEACEKLQAGQPTDNPELALFRSWDQVRDYVKEEDGSGGDLRAFVTMIDKHGADVVLDAMKHTVKEEHADLVVSTAHKSKGRQWQRVRIAADFKEPRDESGKPLPVPPADLRLAYVSVTRAREVLDRGGLAWVDQRLEDATKQTAPTGRVLAPNALPLPPRKPGPRTPLPALTQHT